jgi:hypothetical protein
MSLRWTILLLAAASAFAAEYKASDDGRVVYFTGALADDLTPTRLWRWNDGDIQTLLDTPSLRLLRLTTDGRFALIQSVDRWQILRYGARRPLAEISDANLVSMSPNGRWVVIYRNQPARAVELFELSETGLRSVAIRPDANPNRLPRYNGDFPAMVSDEGLVQVPCGESSCLWDARAGTTQPQPFPFDGSARSFYQWRRLPVGVRSELLDAAGNALGVSCNLSRTAIAATDPTGRRAHLVCGAQHLLYNADTNTTTPLPPEPTLDSTLTNILVRPTARQFLWQPLSEPAPEPISRFDTLSLLGAPTPTGLFATIQTPDFTLEWAGQTLPWLRGSFGYHYAYCPANLVPGATHLFRLTSATRPWLNVRRHRTVDRDALRLVPVNAADPRFVFIHQDFSSLVSPESPARPGERLHLYITGVEPNDIAIERPSNILLLQEPAGASLGDRPRTITLRVVALQTTPYSPSLQLLTLEVPPDNLFPSTPNQTLLLALQLHKQSGDTLLTSGFVWLSVAPN